VGPLRRPPCRQWLVLGRNRCHWHGGRNPGPEIANTHALQHGKFAAATIERHRAAKARAVLPGLLLRPLSLLLIV
jgi:hypothetical protein